MDVKREILWPCVRPYVERRYVGVFVRITAVLAGCPLEVMSCRGSRGARAEVRGARTREEVVHCGFSCMSPGSCRRTWIAAKRWLVVGEPRAVDRR